MSVRLLRTFIAISETGSFAGAADKMFVTQAAVSQQMRRLEDELRIILFNREGRSPQFTQAAKALVPQARDIVERYDQLIASASSESLIAGEIRIGAVPSVLGTLVPRALARLREEYPGIHIRIASDPSADLLQQVERGMIDAAVMSKPDRLRKQYRWEELSTEDIMLAVPAAMQAEAPVKMLTSQSLLRMEKRSWMGELTDEILDDMKLSPLNMMELGSLEVMASMVAHGLGVAIMPRPCISDAVTERIRFVPLPGSYQRAIGVLSRQDNASFPIINALETALAVELEID